jgi:hypothetical protein
MAADQALVARQHAHLGELLAKAPSLASLVFQGRSLAELEKPEGLHLLKQAVNMQKFDPVAMNHGIRRLLLDDFDGEIIWDYPGNQTTIIESDAMTETLELHAPLVIAEILASIHKAEKFPDSDSLTNQKGLWSYRSFYDKAGKVNTALQAACPCTAAVIKALRPNLTFGFVFISILDPYTTIAPHKGSTSLRQRYHLGIQIPPDGRSRIRIGDSWKTWEEGKAFGFNDVINHEVEHWSSKRRIVLIVDTWSNHLPADVINAIQLNPTLLNLAVLSRKGESVAIND